jgi:transcriptional regulator with XRE-family HTH domain
MAEETTTLLAQGTQATRSFADLLRQYRRAAGMTQEELAERAGISPRALRKLESGASQVPRRDTMCLLARALKLGESEQLLLQASVQRRLAPRPLPCAPFPTTDPQMEAEELLELTVQLAGAVPLPYAEALALLVHGDLMAVRGDWAKAHSFHEAALAIFSHLRRRLIAAGVERALEHAAQTSPVFYQCTCREPHGRLFQSDSRH